VFILITLKETGDSVRDALRVRRIHGELISNPGNYRFFLEIVNPKNKNTTHIEFEETIGKDEEVLERIREIVGENNVLVIENI